MQDRTELLELLMSMTPEELERTISLFEKERTPRRSEVCQPHHPSET